VKQPRLPLGRAPPGNHRGVIPAQQVGKWRTVGPMAGDAHDDGTIRITVCDRIVCYVFQCAMTDGHHGIIDCVGGILASQAVHIKIGGMPDPRRGHGCTRALDTLDTGVGAAVIVKGTMALGTEMTDSAGDIIVISGPANPVVLVVVSGIRLVFPAVRGGTGRVILLCTQNPQKETEACADGQTVDGRIVGMMGAVYGTEIVGIIDGIGSSVSVRLP